MKKFFKYNGLSIVILVLFLLSFGAQILTGFNDCNDEINEHHGKPFTMGEYLYSGHFMEATFENWESEFLQMGVFVVLTTFLYQRGSSESKDPDKQEDVDKEPVAKKESPKPVNRGGWQLWLYQYSLSLTFFLLFIISFCFHFYGSLLNYNNEQILKGKPIDTVAQYVGTSRFWFESFQNWQSEFLSVFCVVVFTIFLRHKGSPQSKPVDAPDSETGEGD